MVSGHARQWPLAWSVATGVVSGHALVVAGEGLCLTVRRLQQLAGTQSSPRSLGTCIFPRIPPATSVLYSTSRIPFCDLYVHKTPPTTPKHSFSLPELESGQWTAGWATSTPTGQKACKVDKTFLEVGKKNYSYDSAPQVSFDETIDSTSGPISFSSLFCILRWNHW